MSSDSSSDTSEDLLNKARQLSSDLKIRELQVDSLLFQMKSIYDQVKLMQPLGTPEQGMATNHSVENGVVNGHHDDHKDTRSASELEEENRELRLLAEEQQISLDLIMSKYRAKVMELQSSPALHKKFLKVISNGIAKPTEDTVKVAEMKTVMKKAIKADEKGLLKTEEVISALRAENRGLREMVQIAITYGSLPSPEKPSSVSKSQQTSD